MLLLTFRSKPLELFVFLDLPSGYLWRTMEKFSWKLAYSYCCFGVLYNCGKHLKVLVQLKRERDVFYMDLDIIELFIIFTWSMVCLLITRTFYLSIMRQFVWLLRWLITYLCSVGYIISIASLNFFMAKVCAFSQCYIFLALFNIFLVLKLYSFWYTSLCVSIVQEWVNHDISKSHAEWFFMFFYLSNYWWTLDCSFYIIFISSKQYNIYIVRHDKSYESIHYVWPFNMLTLCS